MEDPKFVQICQKLAYEMARWATTRDYIDGPNASDDEGEGGEAEDSEAEYADESNKEEEGSSDEGTESDPAARGTTANTSKSGAGSDASAVETGTVSTAAGISHDEALRLAADIGADAAAETATDRKSVV